MRLIDADKILYFKGKDIVGEDAYITDRETIDAMPTVDIVRCKDCKYSVDNDYCLFSTADMGEINKMDSDDFCSRGERKDED